MKIVTMIIFREHISIANVTRWWGAWSTCARAKLVRHLCRKKNKSFIQLSLCYIYDFGPRQCLAMPASSPKS